MNFKQLAIYMPKLLREVPKRRLSFELISAPGRGKSDFIKWLRNHMATLTGEGWGYSELFLATQTPPDLIGYQFKGSVTYDGKEYSISDPTLPTWFLCDDGKPVFAHERGILFLDEFGQGEADVKRASAELLLNGKIGPHRLGDGWVVVAASNRANDRSGVTKSFDFVINRRMEIPIQDDIESWTEWATINGIKPLTIAFANQNPHIVFADGVPDKQGPWCTPRSLVMCDDMLGRLVEGDAIPDSPEVIELATGIIGGAAAAQYFAFVRLEREMPKYSTIVNDPMGAKLPEKPDAQMLICFNLAHRITKDDATPVVKYINRMPKEFSVTFAKAACNRDMNLVTTPAFAKWAMENSSLMAAISK
jgi:hypothetical protein